MRNTAAPDPESRTPAADATGQSVRINRRTKTAQKEMRAYPIDVSGKYRVDSALARVRSRVLLPPIRRLEPDIQDSIYRIKYFYGSKISR